MPLGSLILLNVIQEHLEPAIHAAMIQIEAETSDLKRFATALVLAGVDAGIELLEDLIVTAEKSPVEHLRIAKVERGFESLCRYNHALRSSFDRAELQLGSGVLVGNQNEVFRNRVESRCRSVDPIVSGRNTCEGKLASVVRSGFGDERTTHMKQANACRWNGFALWISERS
jgi:hypothetical protein